MKNLYNLWLEIRRENLSNQENIFIFLSLIYQWIRVNLRFFRKGYANRDKLKVVSDIEALNLNADLLYKKINRDNYISAPVIENIKPNIYSNLCAKVPDINIYFIKNVFMFGNSTAITDKSKAYHYGLSKIKPQHDQKNLLGQFLISYMPKVASFSIKNEMQIKLADDEIGIHLMNEYSGNYYHWLFEVLPCLVQINEVITSDNRFNNKNYILFVNDNLPSQCLESIKYCFSLNYELNFIETGTVVFCDKLIYCTDFWLSLDNTKFKAKIIEEFFVDSYAVKIVKRSLSINTDKIIPVKKIYFERSPKQSRALINDNDIKYLLINKGFEIIRAEKLNLLEQIKLMYECKIIIGVSGAVFSNIIFMQKNTHAIIFSPNTKAANYYIFQPMADVSEVNLIHVLTQSNKKASIHDAAFIDKKAIESVLKAIDS